MTTAATFEVIAEAVSKVLSDGRPRTVDELRAALERTSLDLGKDPDGTLLDLLDSDDLPLVLPLDDDRYVDLPSLLAGRVFTHRLTAAEVEGGFLSTGPDLEALSILTDDERYLRLADGSELMELLPGFDDELLGERGIDDEDVGGAAWLVAPDLFRRLGVGEGDLVGVSLRPDGWRIAPVATGHAPDVVAAALAGWVELLQDGPEQLDTVLWTVCADHPAAFTSPLSPVGELLADAGLAFADDLVMAAGFDLHRHRTERRIDYLADLHDIDGDEALAVVVLSGLYGQVAGVVGQVVEAVGDGEDLGEALSGLFDELDPPQVAGPALGDRLADPGPRRIVRELLPLLAEPRVAQALLVETIGAERDGAMALGVFADSLEPLAPAVARPAVRWLRGKAYERLGTPVDAEAAYEAALALDPTFPLALLDLAQLASDRGDAERGLSLLRRAGAGPDDPLVELLEHFRPIERTDLGRNAPCWCGSGRKYKVCHRGREQRPLEERAAWLYQKAGAFLQAGPWRAELLDVAQVRAGGQRTERAIMTAIQDPIVGDVVLFEGGAFEEFLDERGDLLPEDERLLGAQWLLAERSLYEVEALQVGSGFTARDLRTGDRVQVRERLGSRQLRPGMLICARLVPAGETIQCFGGMEPVELHQRDHLLGLLDTGPSPVELVAALSGRFAPPQLQNTEGEPLVLCEAILQTAEPDELAEALDTVYQRVEHVEGQEGVVWHEYVTTHGSERIRATLHLDGKQLLVETNSETRHDRVLATLRSLQPELQLQHDTRQPAVDVNDAMSRAPRGITSTPELDPTDPAIAAALEQFILEQERIWLHEPVPALAGVTPRQAAVDPTRRDDLIRLLDSYGPPSPGTMNRDRLRAALHL